MYIGNDLQIAHPSYKIIDDISSGFNGSTTSFALQVSGATPVPFPISTQQVMISVNGVVQEPDPNGSAGFKLLGSNIVFSSAPANGHAFFGVINAGADYVTAGSEFPDGSATAPSFTFQDDQDTGWFRSGSGAVGFSANGVNTIGFDGNGLTVTGDATFTGDSSKNLFWDKSDGQLEFADNARAIFGNGSDLTAYHDGSNSKITHTGAGGLYIGADTFGLQNGTHDENYIVMSDNGSVDLYYDNVKVFNTDGNGIMVKGPEGGSANVYIYADEGDDNNDKFQLTVNDGGPFHIQNRASGSVENNIKCYGGGAVELYHDNVKKFETTSDGATVSGHLKSYHLKPLANDTYDVGTSSLRWRSGFFNDEVDLPDNGKLKLGSSQDLLIYHDGNSRIQNTNNSCDFRIQSDGIELKANSVDEMMLKGVKDGAVELYYDGVKKFESTSSGINVTGQINVNGSALSAAPEVSLVADGAIGNNVACNVKSNGKVEAVTEIAAGTNYAASSLGAGSANYEMTYDTEHNLFAIWYRQNNEIKCKVGTPTGSGATSSISWGSAQVINNSHSAINSFSVAYITRNNANKHVIGYLANGSSLYVQAVDIASNGGLTIGSASHVTNSVLTSQRPEVVNGHEDSYPFILLYVVSTSSGLGGRDGTINTGTNAAAAGGHYNFMGNSGDYFRDPIYAFTYLGDRTTAIAKNNAGQHKFNTRVSGSNKATTNLFSTSVSRVTMFYDELSTKIVVFYIDNGDFKYLTGVTSTSGAYINLNGSPTTQIASPGIKAFVNFHSPVAYDTVNKKYWLLYSRDSPNQRTFLWGFTVAADGTLTWDSSAKQIAASEIGPQGAIYESSLGNVVAFNDSAYTSYNAASTMDTSNFLGWSAAAASDAATAKVKVVGNTVTGLSGLTPGKKYYVQRDGSVGLTPVSGLSVEAGLALTSTSLLINYSK